MKQRKGSLPCIEDVQDEFSTQYVRIKDIKATFILCTTSSGLLSITYVRTLGNTFSLKKICIGQ